METMTYTPAQLRSILNGLGYATLTQTETPAATFPVSLDDRPLTDTGTVRAIQKFQIAHQLEVSGLVDAGTMTAIQTAMDNLNRDLNRRVNLGFLLNRPVYNAETIAAVKLVQQRLLVDGIASNALREAMAKYEPNGLQHLPQLSRNTDRAFYPERGDLDW